MRILVIVSGCLRQNSSANLCHRAYIQGMIENGHDLTVVSISDAGQMIDESILLPKGAKYFFYDGPHILNHIKSDVRKELTRKMVNEEKTAKVMLFSLARKMILSFYGPFGHHRVWASRVLKNFEDDQPYDILFSLSSPVASHYAAGKLLKKKKVTCKTYCQIWEDPWQHDIYKKKINNHLLNVERGLLEKADKIIYVSPITLKYQAELFPSSAGKMNWAPLPCYYTDNTTISFDELVFGYFGDYYPHTRDLSHFYNVARDLKLNTYFCGMPDNLFQPTETVSIFQRLPLDDLKQYEDKVNVLVFVCNLKGGQIPGKIYQYSATNKKILFILDGTNEEKETLKEYFGQFNRYYFCENTEEDIKRAIDYMKIDTSIKSVCLDYFSPKNITKKIEDKCIEV